MILPFRSLQCAVLLTALCSCNKHDAARSSARAAASVTVALAQPADGGSRIVASGTLARERTMTLSFRIPGVLKSVRVDDGDAVQIGQVLAEVDPTSVAARLGQAEADLAKAERDLARDRPLAAQGWISPARLADRETAVTLARANVRTTAFDRSWAALRAPATGIVLQRHAQAGEVVQPGTPILTVADERSALVLRASLSDSERVRVRLGQKAQVRFDALESAALTGTVTRLDAAADTRTGAFVAEIRVANDPRLKTGFVGEVQLDVAEGDGAPNSLRIPAEALFDVHEGRGYVFTIAPDGKTARKRAVNFLDFDGDDALVTGLASGQRVITAGGAFVSDGAQVNITGDQ